MIGRSESCNGDGMSPKLRFHMPRTCFLSVGPLPAFRDRETATSTITGVMARSLTGPMLFSGQGILTLGAGVETVALWPANHLPSRQPSSYLAPCDPSATKTLSRVYPPIVGPHLRERQDMTSKQPPAAPAGPWHQRQQELPLRRRGAGPGDLDGHVPPLAALHALGDLLEAVVV